MYKRILISAGIIIIALSGADGQTSQSTSKTDGNVVHTQAVDPNLAKQAQNFATLRQIPNAQNPNLVPWLIANAQVLPPPFLYELARRLWDMQRRDDAFEWFAVAYARARYDAGRCIDTTAPQGIAMLPPIASNVQAGIDQFASEFGAAGLRALRRSDIFSSTVSPWWICSHGMAAISATLEKRSIERSAWLKPEAEWEALRGNLKKEFTAFFVEQGKPQEDPIPMSKTAYKVTTIGSGRYSGFVWLDNKRFLFGEAVRGPRPLTALQQWQNDAPIEEIARFAGGWCAGQGIVAYPINSEGEMGKSQRVTFAVGEPGKTKEVIVEFAGYFRRPQLVHDFLRVWSIAADAKRQSPFDCRWVTSESLSGAKKDAEWMPLLEGHGSLSFTADDGTPAQKILYYPTEKATPIELPVPAKNIPVHAVRYFAFKNAYFISSVEAPLATLEGSPKCIPVWWFFPQGARIEEICEPVDAANTNALIYSPSSAGILRVVSTRKTPHGYKPGGIYLRTPEGRSEKIFEGNLRAISVSPDGCRVGVQSNKSDSETTLSVIELCSRNQSGETAKAP